MTFSCTVCGFAESARNRDNGICLDHYQLSIKHECFTSHSKVYFLVFLWKWKHIQHISYNKYNNAKFYPF